MVRAVFNAYTVRKEGIYDLLNEQGEKLQVTVGRDWRFFGNNTWVNVKSGLVLRIVNVKVGAKETGEVRVDLFSLHNSADVLSDSDSTLMCPVQTLVDIGKTIKEITEDRD